MAMPESIIVGRQTEANSVAQPSDMILNPSHDRIAFRKYMLVVGATPMRPPTPISGVPKRNAANPTLRNERVYLNFSF